MVRVVFRNIEKSELMKDAIETKVSHILAKFPGLQNATTTVIATPGPDSYHVKVVLLSRGLKPVILERDGEDANHAFSHLADRLFEVLHRSLERRREKTRSERRKWKESAHLPHEWSSAS